MSAVSQPTSLHTYVAASPILTTALRNISAPFMWTPHADAGRGARVPDVPKLGMTRCSAIVPSLPIVPLSRPIGSVVACITAAPAPSPNRMQVVRSE